MNSNLTVTDSLAEQEVTIIITLAASDRAREERAALISVGVAEQMPVIKTGMFGDAPALIQAAWTAFGVRAQLTETVTAGEAAAEEQLLATADTEADEPAPPPPPPPLSAPNHKRKTYRSFKRCSPVAGLAERRTGENCFQANCRARRFAGRLPPGAAV